MALQLSIPVINARLDAVEDTIGTSAVLKIFTGAKPANCAAANSGTELVSMDLPSNWMAVAASGSKSKLGTWQSTGLPSAGTGTAAGYFRIYASNGTTCGIQGTCTSAGGGGDLILDNVSIASGQVVTVVGMTWAETP